MEQQAAAAGLTRRTILLASSVLGLAGATAALAQPAVGAEVGGRVLATPVPARHVTLKPSIFAQAQGANRAYLVSLQPDRLLHNFHLGAGLPVKAPVYGGWEAQSIAGHTLGHYLSACALQVANDGDPVLSQRLAYTVAQLARVQAAHGDGYVGGTTRWGQADPVGGKAVFEELRRGDIRANRFSLNDGWVPIYTWHKIHAGLLDAHRLAATPGALGVALGLAGYLATILEGLNDDQVQAILVAEHGGLCEAYAETYALTGDRRWLNIARRLRHRELVDPLAQGRDELAGLHANTQIPKIIGLARLYEVAGDPAEARTARFFHQTVTRRHSYAIGGNSDREHFGPPDAIATRLSETTCEACNSYNMLKLTRRLWSWAPDGALFDDYERAQLNHIMAHQRPSDGMFVYFMPMAAGGRRSYSTPEDSFWCCVGSGMESHAKHADSIWWRGGQALYLNLFIASRLDLPGDDFAIDLDTAFPQSGQVDLTVTRAPRGLREIALRLPAWCAAPRLSVNGAPTPIQTRGDGYARLSRRWKAGDRVTLMLPMAVRAEPTPDDPNLVAFLSGPLVLAADLGPDERPFEQPVPALVGEGAAHALLQPAGAANPHVFSAPTAQGGTARFSPFYALYDRRTAVYAPVFTPARWRAEGPAFLAAEQALIAAAARTVDVVYLGEQQPEVDHQVTARDSEIMQINGRSSRKLRPGGWLDMTLARRPGPLTLQLIYWGQDTGQTATVRVDGAVIGQFRTPAAGQDGFFPLDLPLPPGAAPARVRIEAGAAPVMIYEARVMAG
ncbi:glycoside hydrolase family 127 protein [Caulobacter vibrioides]|uniref:beta-L-arabinofuranosidase domain-containing protein n=1 Tax=Caulobacter vibrioides TaxID=155892 RepID=UPI000BB51F68|nr:beta-L-arabinofuranosidase domain-containing protein [Caulobacter vibrioides]ATC25539.1 glycoside hydrolase family 127 protein [Caulobacter vibrioides]AZH13630.1 glycoside hydrolase family 127 protein [Caulobacter vibrioides]PLR14500.1 glycoside hydrolase family 127 protein [Caulobacter vibrioides]